MPFLFQNIPFQSAEATLEGVGVWEGRVTVAGVLDVPKGSPIVLVLGDTTFNGYVVEGGTFPGAAESTYTLAGGTAGWSRVVEAKSYNIPSGVSLAMVAQQLAAAAGEKLDMGGQDQILGDHWTRPAGPASVALSALFPLERGAWRTDPDGVTRPGARSPAPLPPGVDLVVEDQRRSDRWALLALPGDQVSAVLPGAILTAGNLAVPIVVRQTTIKATSSAVVVEVLGEGGLVELLVALVQALTPSRVFGGLWTYQVADADTGRPNLRALATIPGLPAVLACDKVSGVPGVTATLGTGALVLVGFRDGNPARPFVAAHLPGVLPASVVLDAAGTVSLGAGGTALAHAAQIVAWAAGVNATLAAAGHPAAPLVDPTCTKAFGV